jgi:N,N'-diacetylchitobiose transport system substrate-binding protein
VRSTARVGSVMALGLVLAACSGDDEGSEAGDDPAGTEAGLSGDLTVWIMDPGNPEAQQTIDATGAAFETEHEGVTIDIEYVPWPSAHDRFVAVRADRGIGGSPVCRRPGRGRRSRRHHLRLPWYY